MQNCKFTILQKLLAELLKKKCIESSGNEGIKKKLFHYFTKKIKIVIFRTKKLARRSQKRFGQNIFKQFVFQTSFFMLEKRKKKMSLAYQKQHQMFLPLICQRSLNIRCIRQHLLKHPEEN